MRRLMYAGIVGVVLSGAGFVWNVSEMIKQPRDVKLADRFGSVLASASPSDFQHEEFKDDYARSTDTFSEMIRKQRVAEGLEKREMLKEGALYSLVGFVFLVEWRELDISLMINRELFKDSLPDLKMDKETIKVAKNFSKKIKKQFNPKNLILFGSRARGDHMKNSDYNFIIVSENFKGKKFILRSSEF